MSKPLKIALVGFGNIGTGLVRHLAEYGDLMNSRLPRPMQLTTICDTDLETDRGVPTDGIKMTSDYKEIVADPEIEVVVELVGGTGVARDIVEESLRAGKHVVTANKALIATYGGELFHAADDGGVHLLFEASVGAGIPVIRTMHTGLLPDRINHVYGILNGTCNYILSSMEDVIGVDFQTALKEAMQLGYAEPDPTLDIEGDDTAHKIAILASLAFGQDLRKEHVEKVGITRIAPEDIEFASMSGQTIKLLASAEQLKDGTVELSVRPTFIPLDHILGRVRDVLNACWVEAEPIGPTMYYGQGAGQGSTGSGVLADIMLIAKATDSAAIKRLMPLRIPHGNSHPAMERESLPKRYLRVRTADLDGLVEALGSEPTERGKGYAIYVLPEENRADHEERLGKIKALGVSEDQVCEIYYALQP
ncbi:homoserine dehydrogenase [bacterium]|nr:homoserine dehydrogenase [bacterium]